MFCHVLCSLLIVLLLLLLVLEVLLLRLGLGFRVWPIFFIPSTLRNTATMSCDVYPFWLVYYYCSVHWFSPVRVGANCIRPPT